VVDRRIDGDDGRSFGEPVAFVNSRPNGAPPEIKVSTLPPIPARIFENTSLLASFQLEEVGVSPARSCAL